MADLRLIAVASLAVFGCRAEAGSGELGGAPAAVAVPAGWQAANELAAAIAANKRVAHAEAWAQPAMGCYAGRVQLRATGTADTLAKQLVDALAVEAPGIVVRDVVMPAAGADSGTLSFAFERGAYRGKTRATVRGTELDAIACFWNPREPVACEAACTGLVGSLP